MKTWRSNSEFETRDTRIAHQYLANATWKRDPDPSAFKRKLGNLFNKAAWNFVISITIKCSFFNSEFRARRL